MLNSAATPTPTLKRRLLCIVYDLLLLAAVEFLGIVLFMLLTFNSQGTLFTYARYLFLFVWTGAYFVFSWTDSGFTLAMKTWRIKLVKPGEPKVPVSAACVRYVYAWGWLAPALVIYWLVDHHTPLMMSSLIMGGVIAWSLTVFLNEDRQFLHDRLAGTRLVLLPKMGKAAPVQQGAAS